VRNGPCNIEKRLPTIRRAGEIDNLYLSTSNRFESPCFHFTTWNGCHVLWLRYSYSHLPPKSFFDQLTSLPGFNAGYLMDDDDDFLQNHIFISYYKRHNKPYSHLPIVDGDRVDVSANPGYRFEYPGMIVSSGWRMWFGNGALQLFGREHTLNFRDAEKVEELDNGVVFFQLYENPRDCELPENRRRQKSFRKWVKMDHLASVARDQLNRMPSDPVYEIDFGKIETGKFKHREVILLTTWLNRKRKPVHKSEAVQRRLLLQYKEGGTIWKCFQKPPFTEVKISEDPPV
jgi:hypothetical protein